MRRSRTPMTAKRKKTGQKLLIGIVSVSALVAATGSLSFADMDLNGKVKAWADQATANAITTLDSSISSESQRQQERLKEELQAALNAQKAELQSYTDDQKEKYRQAIIAYADQLISSKAFSTEADEAQIKAKLDQILSSAEDAMSGLVGSYVPPQLSYEPPPPVGDDKDGKGGKDDQGGKGDQGDKGGQDGQGGKDNGKGADGDTPATPAPPAEDPAPGSGDVNSDAPASTPPASEDPQAPAATPAPDTGSPSGGVQTAPPQPADQGGQEAGQAPQPAVPVAGDDTTTPPGAAAPSATTQGE